MKTIEGVLTDYHLNYPLERLAPPEQILFLDIETTGFSASTSYLYLIGCVYYRDDKWNTIQWFAQNYSEEADIITSFFRFASGFEYLIHFNGNTFDLPFIRQKCSRLGLDYNFDDFQGIDLYKRISPYKYFLKLPNCRQKTLELFLGIDRKDTFTGGELIGIYHNYVNAPSDSGENIILLHNSDDLKGMLEILPMLAYYDLFNSPVKARKVQADYYRDMSGTVRQEILMSLALPVTLPRAVSASANNCYFSGEGDSASLKVPIYEEELKYFYSNYKDYYYLPTEDVALHKSVAGFVDREHRLPATAATCYTRKYSRYLPQWEVLIEPFFKRDYKSRELFFELTDELKHSRRAFTDYANHVLDMMNSAF